MHWTGNSYSVGIFKNITVGVINANTTVVLDYTDTRFVRTLSATQGVAVRAFWRPVGVAEFPVIIAATLSDAVAGDVSIYMRNPTAGNIDYQTRDIYLEFTHPFTL